MRIPPNLPKVLIFILVIALLVMGAVYLPRYFQQMERIMTVLGIAFGILLLLFLFLKPAISFLYARADGIFKVYTDRSNTGFHVFAYHINTGGDGDNLRDILHYFIRFDNGRLYYKKLISHFMTPADGQNAWGDFVSFEQNVLGSTHLEKSLQKFSSKTNIALALGDEIPSFADNEWTIFHPQARIVIKKYDQLVDEGFLIVCTDTAGGERWRRRV